MRNAILTIAWMGIAAGSGWGQEILTLDRAVEMALENNRALRSSELDVQKAQDKLNANRTRQLPALNLYALGAQQLQSFDFTLQKGVLGTYSSTGPLPSEDVHLKSPLQPTGMFVGRVVQPLTSLIRIRISEVKGCTTRPTNIPVGWSGDFRCTSSEGSGPVEEYVPSTPFWSVKSKD